MMYSINARVYFNRDTSQSGQVYTTTIGRPAGPTEIKVDTETLVQNELATLTPAAGAGVELGDEKVAGYSGHVNHRL
jgi:hypothetical protein